MKCGIVKVAAIVRVQHPEARDPRAHEGANELAADKVARLGERRVDGAEE